MFEDEPGCFGELELCGAGLSAGEEVAKCCDAAEDGVVGAVEESGLGCGWKPASADLAKEGVAVDERVAWVDFVEEDGYEGAHLVLRDGIRDRDCFGGG